METHQLPLVFLGPKSVTPVHGLCHEISSTALFPPLQRVRVSAKRTMYSSQVLVATSAVRTHRFNPPQGRTYILARGLAVLTGRLQPWARQTILRVLASTKTIIG